MAQPMTGTARRGPASEEATALTRVVMGLTVAVGGLAGIIGLVSWEPMALLGLPAFALLALLVAGRPVAAAWAAAGFWAAMLPVARGEGMIGPLVMIVVCAAIAVGPDRFSQLVERDVLGEREPDIERREGIEDL